VPFSALGAAVLAVGAGVGAGVGAAVGVISAVLAVSAVGACFFLQPTKVAAPTISKHTNAKVSAVLILGHTS
jgi:hypothetical protein